MTDGSWQRHLGLFLGAFALISLMLTNLVASDQRLRDIDANFRSLGFNEYIEVTGLTRQQEQELKIAFIRKYAPPRVGAFGNHVIQYMSADSFGWEAQSDLFFNFWYANIGLPELRHYLLYLERIGKLPTDLVIVQITTPNNDMGRHIVDFGGELNKSLVDSSELYSDFFGGNMLEVAEWIIRYEIVEKVEKTFDYSVLFSRFYRSISIGGEGENEFDRRKIQCPVECLVDFENDPPKECIELRRLSSSFRADGSISRNFREYTVPLVMNGDSSNMTQNLFPSDIPKIVKYMKEIYEIISRNGAESVFFITPLYEEPRYTVVDEIFDGALSQLPREIKVIDHRGQFREKKYFYIYDHPSKKYYDLLAKELELLFPHVFSNRVTPEGVDAKFLGLD